MEIELIVTGALVVVLVFISTFESAFGQLSEVALRSLVAENKNNPRSAFLRYLLENRHLYWLTITSGLQPATLLLAIFCMSISMQLMEGSYKALLLAFVMASVLGIAFRQFLPRLITQNQPARVLLFLLPFFQIYYSLFSIPARTIYKVLAIFKHERSVLPEEVEEKANEEIQALLDVGTEEGIIEEQESEMIHSVLEFGETRVEEVMTPRTELIAIDADATIEEARDLLIESNRSRLPVYRGTIEDVEGILHVQDVLVAWQEGRASESVMSIVRPAYFVPETKPVAELLAEMRKSKRKMVLVVDEYGVLAGAVTMKDLIEEIVGEIDEDAPAEGYEQDPDIIEEPDGSFIIKGSTEIRKVELLFDKELETDDFSTIAGFIIKHAGRVPSVGETFEYDGVYAEILEVEHGRVGRVRLRMLAETSEDVDSSANDPVN